MYPCSTVSVLLKFLCGVGWFPVYSCICLTDILVWSRIISSIYSCIRPTDILIKLGWSPAYSCTRPTDVLVWRWINSNILLYPSYWYSSMEQDDLQHSPVFVLLMSYYGAEWTLIHSCIRPTDILVWSRMILSILLYPSYWYPSISRIISSNSCIRHTDSVEQDDLQYTSVSVLLIS